MTCAGWSAWSCQCRCGSPLSFKNAPFCFGISKFFWPNPWTFQNGILSCWTCKSKACLRRTQMDIGHETYMPNLAAEWAPQNGQKVFSAFFLGLGRSPREPVSSMTNCNILTKTINQGYETEGATDKPAKDNPFSLLSTTFKCRIDPRKLSGWKGQKLDNEPMRTGEGLPAILVPGATGNLRVHFQNACPWLQTTSSQYNGIKWHENAPKCCAPQKIFQSEVAKSQWIMRERVGVFSCLQHKRAAPDIQNTNIPGQMLGLLDLYAGLRAHFGASKPGSKQSEMLKIWDKRQTFEGPGDKPWQADKISAWFLCYLGHLME